MEKAALDPARVRFRQSGSDLVDQLGPIDVEKDMGVDREEGNSCLSAGAPQSGLGPRPEVILIPDPHLCQANCRPHRTPQGFRGIWEPPSGGPA